MNAERLVPSSVASHLLHLMKRSILICLAQVRLVDVGQCCGKLHVGANEKHAVCTLRFESIWRFKTSAEPLVPAVEADGRVRIDTCRMVQQHPGVIHIFFKGCSISSVLVVLEQAQHPVQRVTLDAIAGSCRAVSYTH